MLLHIHNQVVDTDGMGIEELRALIEELEVALDKVVDVVDLME